LSDFETLNALCFNDGNDLINNKFRSLTPLVIKFIMTNTMFYSKAGNAFKAVQNIDPSILAIEHVPG
jgi:hypothetical protein